MVTTRSERRSAKLHTCRLHCRYPRRHSPGGRYNESNNPVQEVGRKRRAGRIFEGGVLAGHYGIRFAVSCHLLMLSMSYSRSKTFHPARIPLGLVGSGTETDFVYSGKSVYHRCTKIWPEFFPIYIAKKIGILFTPFVAYKYVL